MADIHRGFENVDATSEERSFFEFLDFANEMPSIAAYRERMLDLCPVGDGSRVLDVGCGLGHETSRLAGLVGKGGRVDGIDSSESLIDEARRRAQETGVPVDYRTGDAHNLPFENSSFDLCRAERVLLYLEDPAKAVEELSRVTRPGGRVVVFDFDYGALFIDSDFIEMTRQIEALIASDPRNPSIGKNLPNLFRKAGLAIEAIVPSTVIPNTTIARRLSGGALSRGIDEGLFTAAQVESWWQEQDRMEQDKSFYHAYNGYVVAGLKT